MKKIFSLVTTLIFLVSSSPLSYGAEVGENPFTSCQYKNTYRYYMSQGEEYLADNQPESALESFKRALIIQPSSEEARLKILKIRQMLKAKAEPEAVSTKEKAAEPKQRATETKEKATEVNKSATETKQRAVERAIITAEDKIRQRVKRVKEEKPRVVYRLEPPSTTSEVPAKPEPKEEYKTPEIDLSQSYPPTPEEELWPTHFDEFYNEYLDPQKFNNGINEKIQQAGEDINSAIAPNKISGEYRLSLGFTNDDTIWKDANADYHNMPGDTSWRYIFGKDRYNSYDKKVYSRLKVDVDNPLTNKISSFNEIVIDPWTFVGKKRIFVNGSAGDNVQMDLKYWSNVSKTINETYRTQKGDIVNVQENKVHDEKISPETYRGITDWGSNRFSVPEVDIDRMYVPIRKSWIDYNSEPYHARLFFMSNQDEALTSDDPMRLSNNKVWWEESPWLDEYDPSQTYERRGISAPAGFGRTKEPLKKGQWIRRQSFIARDSDDQFLTSLRGVSFDAAFDNGTSVKTVAAVPRNLWDRYDQGTSLPLAVRVKTPVTEHLSLGGLYTLKTGFRHNSVEAINNLFAVDSSYKILPNAEFLVEGAVSDMDVEESIGYKNDYTGYAAMVGLNSSGPLKIIGGPNDKYELGTSFTHMDDRFFPGLSNYRLTRKEFEFAKHIYFDKLDPKNETIKIGDGMDVGRNSFKVTTKAEFPENNLDTRFDFRSVHSDGGDFIENVYRAEAEYKPVPKLTLKGLAYYQYLPKTTKHIDPLINAKSSYSAFTDYFAYEDVWLENTSIDADLDPSIGAFSGGLKYDFCDYFSASGIVELTNDPKDWPRGLLNNVYVTDEYKDGVVWDKIVPFLYNQSVFSIPPYSYYGIYKSSLTYYPFKPIKVTLNYVYNENKYAMAIDDNSTHQGIELEYKPNNRLTLGFLYQYTRQNDLYKEFVLHKGNNYVGHHNIYAALDYELNQDQHLTLMFGEYVGYPYPYPENHPALSALDTRHIVRFIYSGTWGEPRSPRLEGALAESIPPLGPLNPPIPGAKFVAELSPGWVKYREKAAVAPVESDWDAFYTKLEFGLDAYDKEELEGSLRFGLFGSFTEEESWDYKGRGEYQKNDTSLRGTEVNVNIGWALNDPSKYISFTPLVNAGYRRVEFERSNFSILGTSVSQLGEVSDVFNVSFLGIGGRIDFAPGGIYFIPNEKLNLYGSGYWAPLVYAPCNNELLGRLECDKGNIYHAEGGCDYTLSDRFAVSLGGFWDLQHLDRTERIDNGIVNVELPDNKLATFGLKLGGSYKF